MAIVTFWNGSNEQVGTTSSAIAFAVQSAVRHNIRILLISTSLNNDLIKESFWKENNKKSSGLFSKADNSARIETNGVEGLERLMRSGKISPERITEYTKVLLKDRLEVLLGIYGSGGETSYNAIKDKYSQIISVAGNFYDMVVVDLDKTVGKQSALDILKVSNIIVAMTSQKAKQIEKIQKFIEQGTLVTEDRTVLTIGKYMEDTKYNAKNITRNLLRKKDLINTVPYNNLFFEASQEGRVIDIFLDFMKIKERDINYRYSQELIRLYDTIDGKVKMLQMLNKL